MHCAKMHPMADDPRRFLPLSAQQFHILLALTDGHLHGYAIIQDVAGRTGGAVRLGTGTLYTALARLEGLGLVDESDRRAPPAEDVDRRRYYRLTPSRYVRRDVIGSAPGCRGAPRRRPARLR